MLHREHSAILSTFIKRLPFVIKTFILSIFEWPFYTGLTVVLTLLQSYIGNVLDMLPVYNCTSFIFCIFPSVVRRHLRSGIITGDTDEEHADPDQSDR